MEMLLLSEERECGKMKKKKIMFIILCMLTVTSNFCSFFGYI
jgi:stage II sporulation protein R